MYDTAYILRTPLLNAMVVSLKLYLNLLLDLNMRH